MDTMDTLLRDHDRRTTADQTIRTQAERIEQLESSNRALIAQNDELRAAIQRMALEPLGLWCPPQPVEPIDELTHRLWTPSDAVQH